MAYIGISTGKFFLITFHSTQGMDLRLIILKSQNTRKKIQEMIQMIKNGKMFLDLPEDWTKIIRVLRGGPAFLEDLTKSTGIEHRKAKSIIIAMRGLGMIEKDHNWKITWRERK